MKTIRENLEEAIHLFETNKVANHINACQLVFLDLSNIDGFDKEALSMLAYYQGYLMNRHKSLKFVGLSDKIRSFIRSITLKKYAKKYVSSCKKKSFGDGTMYIHKIADLISRAI